MWTVRKGLSSTFGAVSLSMRVMFAYNMTVKANSGMVVRHVKSPLYLIGRLYQRLEIGARKAGEGE